MIIYLHFIILSRLRWRRLLLRIPLHDFVASHGSGDLFSRWRFWHWARRASEIKRLLERSQLLLGNEQLLLRLFNLPVYQLPLFFFLLLLFFLDSLRFFRRFCVI
jgi:hypothetical protein